jgi:hypothetical protein
MTDDPNLDPSGLPADEEPLEGSEAGPEEALSSEAMEADAGAIEAGGEAADDLDAAQLEAAAEGAEEEVEDEGEADAETLVEEEGGIEAAPVLAPGGRRLEPEVRGPRVRGPKPARTVFAVDPALRIKDRASEAFVIVSVVVFALIFANAMLFGHGGAFSPVPTPTPVPTVAPVSPSPSGGESPSVAPTTAPSSSPTVAPSPAAS